MRVTSGVNLGSIRRQRAPPRGVCGFTVFLGEGDGVFLGGEGENHVGQGVGSERGDRCETKAVHHQAAASGRGPYVDAQPISGFSQRSLVSKSIFHFLVPWTPDCMEDLAGTKM